MDIRAEKGTTVIFIGCSESQHNFGSHTGDYAKLEVGKEYVVEKTEVHTMHTKVYLEGIEGCFNSVCFDDSIITFENLKEKTTKNILIKLFELADDNITLIGQPEHYTRVKHKFYTAPLDDFLEMPDFPLLLYRVAAKLNSYDGRNADISIHSDMVILRFIDYVEKFKIINYKATVLMQVEMALWDSLIYLIRNVD